MTRRNKKAVALLVAQGLSARRPFGTLRHVLMFLQSPLTMRKPERFAAVNPQISLAALHDRMIVFAQDARGGLVHVDATQRGKACNCRCLACDEALIARHGDIKAHSFAHVSGTECLFAVDAVLNRLAQELIAAAGVFVTPPLLVRSSCGGHLGMIRREESIAAGRLRVDSVLIDRRVHKQRPSVVMMISGHELLLELTYGHRLDAHKRGAIEKLGIAAIEMHLHEGTFDTVEQFGRLLLEDVSGKHWIFNPKGNAIKARLDASVAEELARQRQHIREREAARQQEQRDSLLRQARAREEEAMLLQQRRDSLLQEGLAQARTVEHEPVPARLPTLQYRLRDGGLSLQHEPGGDILLVPETGSEAVLLVFAELGVTFCAERGCYLASKGQLGDIVLALRPFQLSVKSV